MYVCYNTTNPKQTRYIPSHGDGFGICPVFGAPRAKVAAPSGVEERDAVALCRISAQAFAILNVLCLSRRVLEVFLSFAPVAFDLRPDLLPYAWILGSANSALGTTRRPIVTTITVFCKR